MKNKQAKIKEIKQAIEPMKLQMILQLLEDVIRALGHNYNNVIIA